MSSDVWISRFPVRPPPMIGPGEVMRLLESPSEHVIVDIREEGAFARGHLFFAASLPLSRLELAVTARVPSRRTPIVLTGDDDGEVARAFRVLARGGYSDVQVLEGGNAAWAAAGGALFSGVYVPSKAFGELVEHLNHTPRIAAAEVHRARVSGEQRLYVDSRPLSEFQEFTLPGAHDCPGAELLLRTPAEAGDRPIVVNCAGRTRSIIGAQSLINAGIPNPVAALENGTMGWHLIGNELERGADRMLPLPDERAIAQASARALALARQLGVRWINRAELDELVGQAARTIYRFDVRLPEEYLAGHLPGFLNAPGGQLVQSTDAYAPVRGACFVLFDTLGVQAPMTAHWLVQMGHEVLVLEPASAGPLSSVGAPDIEVLNEPPPARAVMPDDIEALRADGAVLIDVDDSRAYRKGHLPGAFWLPRSRIARCLTDRSRIHIFLACEPKLARLACADALDAGLRAAYLAVGSAVARETLGWSKVSEFLCETDDAWYSPYQLEEGVERAMRDYLDWETGLLDRLTHEPGLRFNVHVPRTT